MVKDPSKPVGTADPQMMLVPYKKKKRWRWVLFVFVLLVLASGGGYMTGYYQGIREKLHVFKAHLALRESNTQLEKQIQELQEKAAIHKHGSELERQASERVRKDNIQLQNKVAELQEVVTFYKSIMAPKSDHKGLRIESVHVSGTVNIRRFKYKLVMTQVADNSSYINGNLEMNLLGVKDGFKQAIPFSELSKEQSKQSLVFKFRYFQNFEGEIIVPSDFVPEQIEVIAQSKGRKATRLVKRFDWTTDEVSSDVGQR